MKTIKMLSLLFSVLISAPLWAAASFTAEQEVRVRELIRETLVSNPDIFDQALNAWQQQALQAQNQKTAQAIKDYQQALYHDPGSPRFGAEKPLLTLVYFTDYNCPYCKIFEPHLEKLVKNYPEVGVVIKPLPFQGESAEPAALKALTVWQQQPQKFWAFHQRLMAKKGHHDERSIAAAQEKAAVTAITVSEQSMNIVKKNYEMASELGINGTPATLVGDEILAGAVPYKNLEALVKEQLAQAKKAGKK